MPINNKPKYYHLSSTEVKIQNLHLLTIFICLNKQKKNNKSQRWRNRYDNGVTWQKYFILHNLPNIYRQNLQWAAHTFLKRCMCTICLTHSHVVSFYRQTMYLIAWNMKEPQYGWRRGLDILFQSRWEGRLNNWWVLHLQWVALSAAYAGQQGGCWRKETRLPDLGWGALEENPR